MSKITIYGPPEEWSLGVRAAKSLMEYGPNHPAIVVVYGRAWQVYAKRNKAGISVWIQPESA